MNKKIADLEFGKEGEIRTRRLLESLFGPLEDQNETDENSLFDFKNDRRPVGAARGQHAAGAGDNEGHGEGRVRRGQVAQVQGSVHIGAGAKVKSASIDSFLNDC